MTDNVPATLDGIKLVSNMLPPSAVKIGTDSNGLPVWMETLAESTHVVGSMTNTSNKPVSMNYTAEVGSTRGYSQEVGLSVEVGGGIDLKVFSASFKTTITGKVGFSQAFSKKTSIQVQTEAGPNCTTQVLEATLMVRYWRCLGLIGPDLSPVVYMVVPSKTDTVETGCYRIVTSAVEGQKLAAVA